MNIEFGINTYSQVAIIKLFDFLFQKKSIFQRILDSKEENLDLTERTISTDIHSSVSHEKVGYCYKFFNARFIQTITGILISLTMIILLSFLLYLHTLHYLHFFQNSAVPENKSTNLTVTLLAEEVCITYYILRNIFIIPN